MLENKVALVTGASRGIGRAIAIALAAQGAAVVINYNGSEERARETADAIKSRGGRASLYRCSVGDFQACQEMIQHVIKEYGHLDILVNNAGITRDSLIMKMKEEDFDAVIETNLKGAFNTIRHVSRQMLKQRSGKIINISSVSGILGNAGQANYAAGRCHRAYKDHGKRTGKQRDHSQRSGTRFCGNGDDRCTQRGDQRGSLQSDSAWKIRKAGRYC